MGPYLRAGRGRSRSLSRPGTRKIPPPQRQNPRCLSHVGILSVSCRCQGCAVSRVVEMGGEGTFGAFVGKMRYALLVSLAVLA